MTSTDPPTSKHKAASFVRLKLTQILLDNDTHDELQS